MSSNELKKTPLYDEHIKSQAQMVPFAGWYMPVQYEGLKEEHLNVRSNVGVFDVSHMGEIWVRGEKSFEALQWLTTNDISKLKAGKAQYSLLANKEGGIVDDIIVYCIKPEEEYLVCVNAANIEKDYNWMCENNKGASIENESESWSQIAVQGPKAIELLDLIFDSKASALKSFHFFQGSHHGVEFLLARTGYTGEAGAEVFIKNKGASALWQELLKLGQSFGVKPIGLGARDTLRTEMVYSLYGNEISDVTSPLEAGLGWVVKLNKGEFLGSDAICQKKEEGLKRKLVAFVAMDKRIPRQGYTLFSFDNKEIGSVTSGTLSPTLNKPIGIGYVDLEFSEVETELQMDVRGRRFPVKVVPSPFVKN